MVVLVCVGKTRRFDDSERDPSRYRMFNESFVNFSGNRNTLLGQNNCDNQGR